MLIYDGVKYRVNSRSNAKIRWRCASHEKYGCRAKIHTVYNTIVLLHNEHTVTANVINEPL